MAVVHNNRMQTDFGKRYALTSAADAGVMWQKTNRYWQPEVDDSRIDLIIEFPI